jgi:hypothetical protein
MLYALSTADLDNFLLLSGVCVRMMLHCPGESRLDGDTSTEMSFGYFQTRAIPDPQKYPFVGGPQFRPGH